ncbi:MAG: flagellar protein export ATPase FliI [Candidatus Cloacimonadota bacterium]|nr:MAG: flagellar protein export ATPase FliI [Candidatus Cloacimonadota bacterium]PIE77977.1 MAG: flagellar protein export ATPase FliI [Candidatus Delongbacteria bacterium]
MRADGRFSKYFKAVEQSNPYRLSGKVVKVVGLVIESSGPEASIGDLCYISKRNQDDKIPAEVVGFNNGNTLLMALSNMDGISPGCEVRNANKPLQVKVGDALLGRVIDGLGEPLDGKGRIEGDKFVNLTKSPPDPLSRPRIDKKFTTGIKAIDGLITCGQGQRVGIFAGSGVGKSVLMGMIAKSGEADVNVIALIGERGREVREFIERDLGEEGLKKSVVVTVTSDKEALMRVKGSLLATSIAEYFRDMGKNVLLMMDSCTRYAMALREIGLAIGEPPTTKGYTPSVFNHLPKLLERSGTSDSGNITALYTVLVEGDDMNDPVGDSVRSIIDGHIVLSRKIAAKNHYPAIDILESVSRLFSEIANDDHSKKAGEIKELMAVYRENEDLINIGAYVKGSNPKIDKAIAKKGTIDNFLRQNIRDSFTFEESMELLYSL